VSVIFTMLCTGAYCLRYKLGKMLAYCDNQSNLSHPWVKEGFSPCFYTTLSSSVFAAIALFCGGAQIYIYRKYAVRIEPVTRQQKLSLERLYKLQLVLMVLACTEPVVKLITQLIVVRHGEILWYVKLALATFEHACTCCTHLDSCSQ